MTVRTLPGIIGALVEPGKTYVVYLPHGGSVTVDLTADPGPFTARWFNPVSAKFTEATKATGGQPRQFGAPSESEWVLLLRSAELRD